MLICSVIDFLRIMFLHTPKCIIGQLSSEASLTTLLYVQSSFTARKQNFSTLTQQSYQEFIQFKENNAMLQERDAAFSRGQCSKRYSPPQVDRI